MTNPHQIRSTRILSYADVVATTRATQFDNLFGLQTIENASSTNTENHYELQLHESEIS
jgi:hypothetical protein